MFTGIIEEIGSISNIEETEDGKQFSIKAIKVTSDLNEGDSICVNGVCLTVKNNNEKEIYFDIINETLEKTNLGSEMSSLGFEKPNLSVEKPKFGL